MLSINKEETQQKVLEVLKNYIDLEADGGNLEMNDSLNDRGIDSFKVIYMLLDLEEMFGIQISDSMLSPELFESPNSIYEAIVTILNEKDGSDA